MTKRLLALSALALPLVYFGMQLALAPFYPGYDFLHNPTSLLGIEGAATAPWFNALAITCGALAFGSAAGIAIGLRARAAPLWVIGPVALAVFAVGCGNVWAGVYPLPDPRHGENPFNLAFSVIPIVFAGAAWATGALQNLRPYLTVNFAAYVAVALVMFGFTPIDPASCSGLLQRLAAATIFVPIGVVGWRLRRSLGRPEA